MDFCFILLLYKRYYYRKKKIFRKLECFVIFSGESAEWRALRAYAPYVSYVLYYVPTPPTCPTCPRAQVYFTDWKIKNIGFNEIKWGFVHWCFQGCWILIWTLIKISFFKIGSKNIKLFYAEGQNNTYKCWRSKQHL